MPPSEIRKEARESLIGKWGKAVCIVLAYFVFTFVIGFIQGLIGEGTVLYTIIDIAVLIISVPLSFGLVISFMKLKRGEDVKAFGFLNDGFTRFSKSWGIGLHTFLKMLLPIICFIALIVLITAMTIYSTASAIAGSSTNVGLTLVFAVLEIACLIYIISRGFLYALAYFIGYDNPELSSKECVLKSEALMKGNRGSYFLLELSFIGWAILACFTLGIGMLWLAPYMQVAAICFYEKLAKPEEKVIEE